MSRRSYFLLYIIIFRRIFAISKPLIYHQYDVEARQADKRYVLRGVPLLLVRQSCALGGNRLAEGFLAAGFVLHGSCTVLSDFRNCLLQRKQIDPFPKRAPLSRFSKKAKRI